MVEKHSHKNNMIEDGKYAFLIHALTDCDVVLKEAVAIFQDHKRKTTVTLHGLETAVNKTITMALQLQCKVACDLQMNILTSSVDLIDKLELIAEDIENEGLKHTCSNIHIELTNA